jgi:hypothetical protein
MVLFRSSNVTGSPVGRRRVTGAVDKDIDRAPAIIGVLEEVLDRLLIGHIRHDGDKIAAGFLYLPTDAGEPFGVDIGTRTLQRFSQ